MCGLTGYWDVGGNLPEGALAAMTAALLHRGPDDSGYWHDEQSGLALGFRRLSILDLSPAGHQPMLSACGRYTIVFNGEIYNHLDLRAALASEGAAPNWRGHSDTETLLEALAHWGVKETLVRSSGMFALALWDRQAHTLTLARDRMGEKPLYYGWQGKTFLFGSELKALRAHPAFCASVSRGSLCLLLRYSYIPAPWSIYEGIMKLPPGTWLTLESGQREPRIETYWSVRQTAEAGKGHLFNGDDHEAASALDSLLKGAIGRQMVADVPLGALLSGGIDSSIIVAMMQAQSSRPINTFTIGFRELQQNEAEHARAVARHLGTEHTELYVDPERAQGVITKLGALYDEPFADSSQIPSFLISQLAGQHVKVALTGDGADELFCGYSRYLLDPKRLGWIASLPPFARHGVADALTAVSPRHWDGIYKTIAGVLPARMRFSVAGDKVHKLAEKLRLAGASGDWYRNLMTEWPNPEDIVCGGAKLATLFNTYRDGAPKLNGAEEMMFLDSITYLPDDILTKVDRAAMGVGLETRVPFLDHKVVEMAWGLPMDMKFRDGQGKWILRQVLDKYVPRHLVDRPKQGFGVPLADWLRGPLRDWAETLLSADRLQREGYFRPELIRKKWAEHLSGQRNWHARLWSVLMFQAWLETSN